jgi:hypothetical protein
MGTLHLQRVNLAVRNGCFRQLHSDDNRSRNTHVPSLLFIRLVPRQIQPPALNPKLRYYIADDIQEAGGDHAGPHWVRPKSRQIKPR